MSTTQKRRQSDWNKREEAEISSYDLLPFILSDVLPEFGEEGLRDELWVVEGSVIIPDVPFTESMDLRNVNFRDGLFSDNESFAKMAQLSPETMIRPLIKCQKAA